LIGDSDLDRESLILAAIGEKREKMLSERKEKREKKRGKDE